MIGFIKLYETNHYLKKEKSNTALRRSYHFQFKIIVKGAG